MRSKNESKFAEIIKFVDTYYEDNGRSPSTREIASEVGMSYPMVSRYLSDLRDRGEIEYDGHRGIVTNAIRDRMSMVRVSTGGPRPRGDRPALHGAGKATRPTRSRRTTGNGERTLKKGL